MPSSRWNRDTVAAVESVPSPNTVDLERAQGFVHAYLRELPGLLRHRAEKGYRGLRFTRYVHRQKAIHDICEMVATSGSHTVVAFGDWKGGYKSPVSRRCAGPLQDIKRRLAQRSDVTLVGIDEFRTSVTCSCCKGRLTNMKAKSKRRRWDGEVIETYGRVHKVLHCKNSVGISACRGLGGEAAHGRFRAQTVTWNRDVNASRNILELVQYAMRGLERPTPFRRCDARSQTSVSADPA
jgi:hypothetical protein